MNNWPTQRDIVLVLEDNRSAARQEVPGILWNPKVHYCIHKRPSPVPILSHISPVYASPCHFLDIYFDITLRSTPRSFKWSLSLSPPQQNPLRSSAMSRTCHMPRPLILLYSITRIISCEEYTASVALLNDSWRVVYTEELLARRPTTKLEYLPLSAVRDCLFNTFAATLHIWNQFLYPQPEDRPCCGDRDPLITERLITSSVQPSYCNQWYLMSDCWLRCRTAG